MAGYKETPRQKMIAMLYLVLTALLALNVSKQILDAFVIVNESMETTNENFSKKLENTYSKFRIQYELNPNKVGPYWTKAQMAEQYSSRLAAYVDSIRYVVVMQTEGLKTLEEAKALQLRNAQRKDNYDRPTRYFIGSSHDGSGGESKKLRVKIDEFKENMLNLVDPKYRNTIKIGLDTKGPFYDADGKKQNWEMHNFYRTILAADVTILNKIKAEIYNAEFDVVNNLLASVTAEDWKFDKIAAKVIPKSSYVFVGDEYQAEILVAAYDTKQNPDVRYMIGIDSLTPQNFKSASRIEGTKGAVTLKLSGTGEGLRKFAGIIKVINPLGDTMSFHFKDEFIVSKPALNVSPSKMNVFYIGIDNPVDIVVGGGPEKINPSISVGKIRQEGSQWIVYDLPRNAREAVISVSAVFSGKQKPMGNYTARLKSVPDFIAQIGGMNEGVIDKSLIIAAPYLVAVKPVGFDFDIKYYIKSYTFVTNVTGSISEIRVQGSRLTPEIMNLLNMAKRNTRIWFESIVAEGPDGQHNLQMVNLKLR